MTIQEHGRKSARPASPHGGFEVVIEQLGKTVLTRAVAHGETLIVGRAPDCGLCLNDPALSRKHAQIRVDGSDVEVRDTSSNGTLADGTVLHQQSARVGFDRPIALGSSVLCVRRKRVSDVDRRSVSPALPPSASARRVDNAPVSIDAAKKRARAAALSSAARADVASVPPPPPPPPPPPLVPRLVKAEALTPAPAPIEEPTPAGITLFEVDESVASVELMEMEDSVASVELSDRATEGYAITLRRETHRLLLEQLEMSASDLLHSQDPALRPRVLAALRWIVRTLEPRLPPDVSPDTWIDEIADEAVGLGPLERLLAEPSISEILVVDARHIYVQRGGHMTLSDARFTDEACVRAAIERLLLPVGRRLDAATPLLDARLADGSRVNVVLEPLAVRGSSITIRKPIRTPITLDTLLGYGALSPAMARFLDRCVRARKNLLISGAAESGKTTLLNVLAMAIGDDERIVTIEDALELQLSQPHWVALETQRASHAGSAAVALCELIANALRMRPDRIVVGECRGREVLELLQAMSTGHAGALTSIRASSPEAALHRLETLAISAGGTLPARAIREQIAESIDVVVQLAQQSDGGRRLTSISEVTGVADGTLRLLPLFAPASTGHVEATGYLPSFLPELIELGLIKRGERFL